MAREDRYDDVHQPLRFRVEPFGAGCRETRFARSPMKKFVYRSGNTSGVTFWVGEANLVVAISGPVYETSAIHTSVDGTHLILEAVDGSDATTQCIDLPCPVEPNPMPVVDKERNFYILLQKKQTAMP